mgnify:CR=1 FL=1
MNTGTIFLGGGGDTATSFKFDEYFFSCLSSHAKILYIPVAMRRGVVGYESCFDWFSGVIGQYSTTKNIDFEMILENDEIKSLNKFEAIYIGGGNTYYLLKYLNHQNRGQSIIEYLQNGGMLYGGSAGAIVLGKDIRTVEMENDAGSTSSAGLNLLGGKSVLCHYHEGLKINASAMARVLQSPILALPEDSGVVLRGGKLERVFGQALLFNEQEVKVVDVDSLE